MTHYRFVPLLIHTHYSTGYTFFLYFRNLRSLKFVTWQRWLFLFFTRERIERRMRTLPREATEVIPSTAFSFTCLFLQESILNFKNKEGRLILRNLSECLPPFWCPDVGAKTYKRRREAVAPCSLKLSVTVLPSLFRLIN